MIKTIVVPTDGSSHAMKAVTLASDIAAKYNAKVLIVHVLMREATPTHLKQISKGTKLSAKTKKELTRLERIPIDTAAIAGAYAPIAVPVPYDILEEVGTAIAEKARAVAKKKGVKKLAVQLIAGNAADSIIAAAKKAKADMIVMGSRGFSGWKGLLLGSVSHKVSNLAECTCVTVK